MTNGRELLATLSSIAPANLAAELAKLDGAPCQPAPRSQYNLACLHADQEGPGGWIPDADAQAAIALLGADSRRSGRPWALDDPVLRTLRTGAHGAGLRGALRRGGVDSGAWPLSRLDAIGVRGAEQLARAGVTSADELIRQAGPAAARARLAKATGLDAVGLEAWAHLGELATVVLEAASDPATEGLDQEARRFGRALDLANLLSLAGIGTVKALVSATTPPVVPPKYAPYVPPPPASTDLAGKVALRLTALNARETIVVLDETKAFYDVSPALVILWATKAGAATSRVEAASTPPPEAKPAKAGADEK